MKFKELIILRLRIIYNVNNKYIYIFLYLEL